MVSLIEYVMLAKLTLQPAPQGSKGMSGNAVEESPFCAALFVDSLSDHGFALRLTFQFRISLFVHNSKRYDC